jgi:hypothetical protein
MRFNNFDNTIFGITITGQGINGVVEGTHVVVLRHLVSKLSRRLSLRLAALRLASWRAIACMPAAMPWAATTPAMATCPRYMDRGQQRVVETRGTVGVC